MNLIEEIKNGESKTLELKEKLPGKTAIVKTLVAFSNTSGGKLIVGVNDQRQVVGLEGADIFEIQDKIASTV